MKTSSENERSKGLIHLSRHVLEKVRSAGVTSGNKLAEELMHDFPEKYGSLDYKNIQRRVYDALNVLQAQGIITKLRNEIRFHGGSSERRLLETVLQDKQKQCEEKRRRLGELIQQQLSLKLLTDRNEQQRPPKMVDCPFVAIAAHTPTFQINELTLTIRSKEPLLLSNDSHVLANLTPHVTPNALNKEVAGLFEDEPPEQDYRQMYFQLKNFATN